MDNSKKKNYTKRDIVEVLLEDAYLKCGVVYNESTIKWGEIFNHMYDNKLTQQQLDILIQRYYDLMVSIHYLDEYSMVVDYLLNRNKNITEDSLRDFEKNMNILEEPDNFSNKNRALYIRNAYCHNNNLTKDKIKIDSNRIYTVDIDNSNFVATFNEQNLIDMISILGNNSRNSYYMDLEGCFDFDIGGDIDKQLDDIYVMYYPFKLEFPRECVNKELNDLNFDRSNKVQVLRVSEKVNNYLQSKLKDEVIESGKSFNIDDYKYYLDEDQKNRIKELINFYYNNDSDLYFDSENNSFNMEFIVKLVLPMPHIYYNKYYEDMQFLEEDLSLNQSYIEYKKKKEEKLANQSDAMKLNQLLGQPVDTREYLKLYRNYLTKLNKSLSSNYAMIRFIKYYMSDIHNDKTITVDNKNYTSEKIRNSLVHFRWYIGANNTLVLYDASPNHQKLYNFNYKEVIPIESFFETCRLNVINLIKEGVLK